jgi:uncharacterized protein (DUF4415 family)
VGGEEREIATGLIDDCYVTVVFTRRASVIRIISLRRARHGERNIRKFSATELREQRARGESKTDLVRIREKDSAENERAAVQQLEEDGIPSDWFQDAQVIRPDTKKLLSLRLDADVVEWFRNQGPGYQTRINAVLKAYMKHTPSR